MIFHNLQEIEPREIIPHHFARFIHTDTMTFAHWEIKADARLPEHSHSHEQVAHVISGKYELTVDGRTEVLGPGMPVTIPPNVIHSGLAITDCAILDVFHPVREDYIF